jgi:hydroxymethylpyrimidine pyrophosphatase-like HAD family hydrolase
VAPSPAGTDAAAPTDKTRLHRYHALCCDFDGTIAHDSTVSQAMVQALQRVVAGGRHLVLATGRELDDLRSVFPEVNLFHRVVAENGALLYTPETGEQRVLCGPPSEMLVNELRRRHVQPLSVGRAIVATWEPHDATVLAVLRELGLELNVVFNKGAVMVLPSGVNKATGLRAALHELAVAPEETVGIGDAENDHAFLDACGLAIAVANALPSLKQHCHLVTQGEAGEGVQELIERWLAGRLPDA